MPEISYHRTGWIVLGLLIWLSLPGPLFGSATGILKYDLQQARERLNTNLALRDRISADLKTLRQTNTVDPDTVSAYEAYLTQVNAMVAEDRRTVAKLETLKADYVEPAADLTKEENLTEQGVNATISPDQVENEVVVLDRKLASSLAAFDAMLLKELELIRIKSAARMQDLSEEAAAAARRLKEKGIDLESESTPESSMSSEEKQKNDTPKAPDDANEETEWAQEKNEVNAQTNSGSSGKKGTGGKEAPQDRNDRNAGQDDDIVARQLREAAEKETDPDLKEKLWKEYEAYKKNRRQID